jgi:hypothetical protein
MIETQKIAIDHFTFSPLSSNVIRRCISLTVREPSVIGSKNSSESNPQQKDTENARI